MSYLSKDYQVRDCNPAAANLASALITLLEAEEALKQAKSRIPSYTAQFSKRDYVANEQEAWNRAADSYHRSVLNAVKPSPTPFYD